jgi:Heavy-metal-associated domain.
MNQKSLLLSFLLFLSGLSALAPAPVLAGPSLTRIDFRLEKISCGRCIISVRDALRKTPGVAKCEIALRKPYGAVLIVSSPTVTEAKIKEIVDKAEPGTHPIVLDLVKEPVKTIPVVLMPKYNGLSKGAETK